MASFINTIDEAMKTLAFNKFKSYFEWGANPVQKNSIEFAPKSIAQRRLADKRSKVPMEFMSLWREPPRFDWARQRSPVTRRGISVAYESGGITDIVTLKAAPATLDYSLYFWSESLDRLAQIAEAYLFWVHTTPGLVVYFGNTYILDLYTKFGELIDESPLDKAYEIGTYYVYKAPIKLDGWIVSQTTAKIILEITMNIYYNMNLDTATPGNSELLATDTIITSDES